MTATVTAVLSGCHHVSATRVEGTSAFAFVERPAPPSKPKQETAFGELQPADILVPAEPMLPLAQPVYPPGALGRQHAPVLVGVRIAVDAEGRVAQVRPSLLALSTPGPFAEDFFRAVEAAVTKWRFTAAEQRHLQPTKGVNGQDYWLITRSEKVDGFFDLSFTFTAIGGVVTGPPAR